MRSRGFTGSAYPPQAERSNRHLAICRTCLRPASLEFDLAAGNAPLNGTRQGEVPEPLGFLAPTSDGIEYQRTAKAERCKDHRASCQDGGRKANYQAGRDKIGDHRQAEAKRCRGQPDRDQTEKLERALHPEQQKKGLDSPALARTNPTGRGFLGVLAGARKSTGRDERIRTSDPHTPSVMRYQAALRPEPVEGGPIGVTLQAGKRGSAGSIRATVCSGLALLLGAPT